MNQARWDKKQKYISLIRIFQSWLKYPQALTFRRLFRGHNSGKSLPGALVTLAVGSLLLTPFLSFVSSRAAGTGTATEIFDEGYAADAGIEFAIWSLLNNPSFRSQVDLNSTFPQALVFPGSLNGYTPTITVTGLPLGIWYIRTPVPVTIERGGALAYTGGNRVYTLRGDNSTDFGFYSISGGSWSGLASTPEAVRQGGDLVYGGSNFLYAFRGRNRKDFWRYNISNNAWASMEDAPRNVTRGGALVYDGSDYIYAFRGNRDNFWRYDIDDDSWDTMSDAPGDVRFGADLVYTGGNFIYAFRGRNRTDFWRYNISADTWSSMQSAPDRVNNGGALAYYGGDYIYALRGNSNVFWRYSISSDSWTVLTNTPASVGRGGDLIFTYAEGGFACRGGNRTDFWEFEVTPPRYDISSQTGTITIDSRLEIDGSNKTILFWDIE